MDFREISERIQSLGYWYHNLDLGGVMTNPAQGDYPLSRWRIIEPHIPADLTGKSVLDIGCNAGFFSLQMKRRGASRVVGIETIPQYVEQARFAAQVLGLTVEYRCQTVYDFVLTNEERFDYVLFLGTFYHLRHPLLALDMLARTTVEKMYFQTVIRGTPAPLAPPDADYPVDTIGAFEAPSYPKMYFIAGSYAGDPTNWWLINEACAWTLLRDVGFANVLRAGDDVFVCTEPSGVSVDHDRFGNPLARDPTVRLAGSPGQDVD
jgi:tRNA (mo5U34)-methyltransferase